MILQHVGSRCLYHQDHRLLLRLKGQASEGMDSAAVTLDPSRKQSIYGSLSVRELCRVSTAKRGLSQWYAGMRNDADDAGRTGGHWRNGQDDFDLGY